MRSWRARLIRGGIVALAMLAQASIASAQPKATRNVYDLLALLYGIPNAPACQVSTTTVGTSPVRVLYNDPRAVSVFAMNLSSGVCYLGYNGQVSSSIGAQLGASGGSVNEDYRVDMVLQTYEHWFVCANSSETILTIRCDLN